MSQSRRKSSKSAEILVNIAEERKAQKSTLAACTKKAIDFSIIYV